MKISIIIPVHNEEATIIELLNKVNNQNSSKFDLEIIVVDDCSTDKTKILLNKNSNLYTKIIELQNNLGKGGAVREGLLKASGEYVLFQDGDLEYDPNDYQKIFNALNKNQAEIVIGSRFLTPDNTNIYYFFNKLGNYLITFLFNLLFRTKFTDIYSCYLCFRKDLINPRELKSNGWEQQAEILALAVKTSERHYEVPISYSGRSFKEGKKIKARHIFKVLSMIIKKRLF